MAGDDSAGFWFDLVGAEMTDIVVRLHHLAKLLGSDEIEKLRTIVSPSHQAPVEKTGERQS